MTLKNIKISLKLINLIRQFKHKNHQLDSLYIISLKDHLNSIYDHLYPDSSIEELSNHPALLTIFSLHFYLACIYNLDEFVSHFDKRDNIVEKINVYYMNSTNIFNVRSLFEIIQIQPETEKQNTPIDLDLIKNLAFNLEEDANHQNQNNDVSEDEKNVISVAQEYINLTINSGGKIDPEFTSYLCNKLQQINKVCYVPLHFINIMSKKENQQSIQTYINSYSSKLKYISEQQKSSSFDTVKYNQYLDKLILYQNPHYEKSLLKVDNLQTQIDQLIEDLQGEIQTLILTNPRSEIKLLEKLLIYMLGHYEQSVREAAVNYLNIIYDQTDWQLQSPFRPKVTCIEDTLRIDYLLESDGQDNNYILLLYGPSLNNSVNQYNLTWHVPQIKKFDYSQFANVEHIKKQYIICTVDLGQFTKCGFYDWKLFKFNNNGQLHGVYKMFNLKDQMESSINLNNKFEGFQNLQPNSQPVQGRYIVQPRNIRQLQIHEIFIDISKSSDQQSSSAQNQQLAVIKQSESNITKKGNFKTVKEDLKKYKTMGINCLYLMGALERDNCPVEINKEQKAYKKPEASALAITCRNMPNSMLGGEFGFKELLKEAKQQQIKILVDSLTRISSSRPHRKYKDKFIYTLDSFGKQIICYGTDGRANQYEDTALLNYRLQEVWDMHIDELIDLTEKYCIDGIHLDNGWSWPPIMMIDRDEMYRKDVDGEYAYTKDDIINGKIVIQDKLGGYWATQACEKYPNPFLIKLSKTLWQKFNGYIIIAESWNSKQFENTDINIIKSGVIPRVFHLPKAISLLFGQKLHRYKPLQSCERQDVNIFKSWYENQRKLRPPGAIVVQSTTYYSWPQPVMLYKTGTWPAVDIFFLYLPDIPMTFIEEEEGKAYRQKVTNVYTSQVKIDKVKKISANSKSSTNLVQQQLAAQTEQPQFLKLIEEIGDEKDYFSESRSGSMVKINSMTSISELSDPKKIQEYQQSIQQDIGPFYDLSQIKLHYQHRRQQRLKKEVFTRGLLISLGAEQNFRWHRHVLTFARYTDAFLVVVAINFTNESQHVYLDTKNLKKAFPNYLSSDIVLRRENFTMKKYEYFTLQEFINEKHFVMIQPNQSLVMEMTIIRNTPQQQQAVQMALEDSLDRLQIVLTQPFPALFHNEIAFILKSWLQQTDSLQSFLGGYLYIYENIFSKAKQLNFGKVVSVCKEIIDDKIINSKMFAFIEEINRRYQEENNPIQTFPNIKDIIQFRDENKLGTIAFCTPELGRFSTMGGLGVMVDELSQGLAELGQDICVVSPYYEKNKKGQSGYLATDPIDKFSHLFNVDIYFGGRKFTLGIWHGVVKKVKLYFLHNPEFFPFPYPDGDAVYSITQLTLFARASLELFCQLNARNIQRVPQLIVTNDWFTGLIPAYAKQNTFGSVYDKTKFFHIVHNLDPNYEGRLWPKTEDGNLSRIHELHIDWLVDPYWNQIILNPSRCALKTCHQWGTVSRSYREELLQGSPLSSILGEKPFPFGFPNGLPKQERLNKLIQVCENNHLKAKEKIQQKYFKFQKLDDSVCLMAFVGRITEQKGVNYILYIAEQIIQRTQGKVQILVGGQANLRDPYGSECAFLMRNLTAKYPYNFWADAEQFFTDGPLINCGADFGLMPSKFEPGGIVQHEFFVASTPVIAFRTGGLKDTVFEYIPKTKKGNGFTFDFYTAHEFYLAIERAYNIFQIPADYQQLRKNSFESVIDVSEVARAWATEFYNIFGKIFVDIEVMGTMNSQLELGNLDLSKIKAQNPIEKVKDVKSLGELEQEYNFRKAFWAIQQTNIRQHKFGYKTNQLPRPKKVYVVSSHDNYKLHEMKLDVFQQSWTLTMPLEPGEYFYKFVVDGEWVCNEYEPKENDLHGNINNYINII